MAKPRIVILGAGLGGAIAAFEVKDAVRDKAEVTVVSLGDTFHFVPSNPWVAVHWRKREAIEVKLPPVFKKRGIAFSGAGALWANAPTHEHNRNAQRPMSACLPKQPLLSFPRTNKQYIFPPSRLASLVDR